MERVIVGVFHKYAQAQAAVRDLEIAGITGEQVEVISGPDEDVRALEAGLRAQHAEGGFAERIAHFFRSLTGSENEHVQNDYVEDQEFYAGEVRRGRTMLIVRPPSEREQEIAIEAMRAHGGASVTGKKQPTVLEVSSEPEPVAPQATGGAVTTMGAPRTTTGNYGEDLEGRGKELRTHTGGEGNIRVYSTGGSTGAPLGESSQPPGTAIPISAAKSDFDAEYREHYKSALMGTGAAYQVYFPAYEFGSRMANEERYRGRNYEDAEPHLRREYEESHPGSTWEKFKEAVRYGWDRVAGKRARGAKS